MRLEHRNRDLAQSFTEGPSLRKKKRGSASRVGIQTHRSAAWCCGGPTCPGAQLSQNVTMVCAHAQENTDRPVPSPPSWGSREGKMSAQTPRGVPAGVGCEVLRPAQTRKEDSKFQITEVHVKMRRL